MKGIIGLSGHRRTFVRVAGVLLGLMGLLPFSGVGAADNSGSATPGALVFGGSGSTLAITRVLAREYARVRPEVTIEVPPSIGSSGAIRAAADGAVAVGMVSRPLSPKEEALGLTVVPLARTPIVIAAHRDVADDDIAPEDLVRIYQGAKRRWRDGREIVVITRQPGDSFILEFEQRIPGFKEAFAESQQVRRWMTVFTDDDMYARLIKTPSALSFADTGTLVLERLPIKPLRVRGVAATADNVASGRYPYAMTLSFVFRADRVPPEARAFVDWVRSPKGQRILRANGFARAG